MTAMRRVMIILFWAAALFPCTAQSVREMELILKLTGCSTPEEVDSEEVERLSALLSSPLKINMAGMHEIASSGLLTRYQMASLADYRSRHGDVMSYSELAALDGFGADFTSAAAPFLSLVSKNGISGPGRTSASGDIAFRSGVRASPAAAPADGVWPETLDWSYGMKFRVSSGRGINCSAGFSNEYSFEKGFPSAFTGSFAADFRKICGTVIIGDFNARFGQGLALWNGMTMGALGAPSSFMRRPQGLSSSWSYTGNMAHTGAAAEFSAGHFCISAFAGMPGLKKSAYGRSEVSLLAGVNAAWHCRSGQISVMHYGETEEIFSGNQTRISDMKTSTDMAFCFKGTDVFSEFAFDWASLSPAVLAGTVFRVREDVRLSAMARYYSPGYNGSRSGAACSTSSCKNECGLSLAGEFNAGKWIALRGMQGFGSSRRRHSGTFSVDAALFPSGKLKNMSNNMQVQLRVQTEHMAADWLKFTVRTVVRYRDWGEPFRGELRTDISVASGAMSAALRLNAVLCTGFGMLGYAEGGYRTTRMSVFLRQGFFGIDSWNDRIYVYERDAPGSFVVPAFFGRGLWTSAVCSWKCTKWMRLYVRASCTAYPFMPKEKRKPGNAELRVQCVFKI